MIKPAIRRLLLPPFALTALLVLAGCGIKGALELPPDAQVTSQEAKDAKGRGQITPAQQLPGNQPSMQERRAAKQMGKPVQSDEPFFLDPLLR